jgi:prevent-host-death family protein
MKSVKVSDLKAHLSEYLARVRRGETVEVRDRETPIARIVPLPAEGDDFTVLEPSRPVSDLKRIQGVRPRRPVDVVDLLRESRDQR